MQKGAATWSRDDAAVAARGGYGVALLATLGALAARIALDPLFGTRHRFALLYVAALLVASRFGLGPGLAVVLAGALGMAWLAGLPTVWSVADVGIFTLDVGVYVGLGATFAWLAASARAARQRVDSSTAAVTARTEALIVSEERYRSFIRQSSEGIWRIELEQPVWTALPEQDQVAAFYRYAYLAECNDAMARMYGFEHAEELVGARLDALLVPSDPANRDYLLAFIRSGYRVNEAESHERDRGGESRYFLNNLVGTIENGHVVRAWGTQRDISVRRRTEQALRDSEERLRLALEAGQMGIWDWNMASGEVRWSSNIEALRGLNRESFGGTYEAFLALIHPDDRERFTSTVQAAMEHGGSYEAEFRVVSPRGRVRWMLGKGQTFPDVDGKPARMIGMGIDVTARKRTEEELRESIARLQRAEQDIQQLFILEREARADAERSNRAKDEFLTTLSHELRSPLSAALSWTHMLRRGQLDREKTARALETIERTTRLQVRLIEDLLDISRIVSGKLTLETGVVDLRAVIEAAAEATRAAIEARQLRLTLRPPNEVLLIAGDAARLEQVFGNLLANAIKFTPAGGEITIAWQRVDGDVEVTMRDTGVGIAPDVLPHIFDRFRQADSSTTRRHGGLGLGLAIVRHLIELHGGRIDAESEGTGRGALMRIRLPLDVSLELGGEPRRAVAPGGVPTHRQLAGVRVLIIDDEADIRDFLATALMLAGAEVTSAASATEAHARLSASAPDIILSDLAMPDCDGYTFLRELRAAGRTMPVIALTALASAADRQRALAAGFDVHVTKPVDPPVLIATIARVLDAARSSSRRPTVRA
jgi:PAS domain S-box-containing protein